jgi:hypothetical protein
VFTGIAFPMAFSHFVEDELGDFGFNAKSCARTQKVELPAIIPERISESSWRSPTGCSRNGGNETVIVFRRRTEMRGDARPA